MKNLTWKQLRPIIVNQYKTIDKAFSTLIKDWHPPTCKICNNVLKHSGSLTLENGQYVYHYPTHLCCLQLPCYSAKISSRSKEYRILVLGQSSEEVEFKNKARLKRGVETARKNGKFLPENNPTSKIKLREKGLSEKAIIELGRARGNKIISTKRENGWYDEISNNPFSKKFYLNRGLSKDEVDHLIKKKNHNCKEFWLARDFSEADAIVKAKTSADTNSLRAKISRHGEIGIQKYVETRNKMSSSWSPRSMNGYIGTSKSAIKLFDAIKEKLDIKCIYKSKNDDQEWFLSDKETIYFYDFMIPDLKIIIEFNGEHVHPRKDMLSKEQFSKWKHAFSKESAEKVYEKDQNKIYKAINMGYNVLVLWSKDKFDHNINVALTFIKEHKDGKIQNHC